MVSVILGLGLIIFMFFMILNKLSDVTKNGWNSLIDELYLWFGQASLVASLLYTGRKSQHIHLYIDGLCNGQWWLFHKYYFDSDQIKMSEGLEL